MHHKGDEYVFHPIGKWSDMNLRKAFDGAIVRLIKPSLAEPETMAVAELVTDVTGLGETGAVIVNDRYRQGFRWSVRLVDLGERVYNARTGERKDHAPHGR